MNRRSFAQSVGSAVALSAFARSSAREQTSSTATPGRMMAIAAHPGDGLFTMGAALGQQIEQRGSGALVCLSMGEKGAPRDIPAEQYGELQRAATQKAAHMLGAEVIFLSYPDAEIPFNEESALRVCDAIRKHKPDIVLTHWSGSWHKDHQNCHLVVRDGFSMPGWRRLRGAGRHTQFPKSFMPKTGRIPATLCRTPTSTSRQSMKNGFRHAISIRCGEVRRDFFDITITTAAFRSCAGVCQVLDMPSH